MRHVIYLLLIVNLVYFGWHMPGFQKQGEVERVLPEIPATAVPLVTLQEMEEKQKQEPVAEPEEEPAPELLEPEPAPEQERSDTAPEPVTDSEPESQQPESQGELATIESLTEQEPPGSGGAIICQTLGPIVTMSRLRSLSDRLDDLGVESRHRTTESREQNGYWIYMPVMDYSKAQEIKRTLDEHHDKEYYIGRNNFISLGTFNEKSRADIRMSQVRKLGLEARLERRYRNQTLHWLDIPGQAGNTAGLEELVQEYPDIKLQDMACY